jgi:hypothetical protein
MRLKAWAKFAGTLIVLFALDAVLIFAPAFAPISRQSAKSPSQRGTQAKQECQAGKEPYPTPTAGDGAKRSGAQQVDAAAIGPHNKPNEITVVSLPEISVSSDYKGWVKRLYDWGPWAFSGLVVVSGFFQIWLLKLTLDRVRRQGDVANRQAKIMVSQVEEMRKVSDIANRTLIAQFRPKVIIRRIELIKGSGVWGIHVEVANVGGTNANVTGGKIDMRWRVGKELRDQPLHRESIESFSLEAGGETSFNIAMTANERFESKMHVFQLAFEEGRPDKYCMQAVGVLRYTDDSGAGKKTGFFRNLDIETRRFYPVQNSEDEYQD